MEEMSDCEYSFLEALGRDKVERCPEQTLDILVHFEQLFYRIYVKETIYESHMMSMGDENKDGKLKFKEWLTAGSIWDLAFGRAMIDCLTEGWFSNS